MAPHDWSGAEGLLRRMRGELGYAAGREDLRSGMAEAEAAKSADVCLEAASWIGLAAVLLPIAR